MRVVLSIALILVAIPGASVIWSEDPHSRFERSLSRARFDSVNLDGLSIAASRHNREDSDEAVRQICRLNLAYIYHHKLNRQRFLVAPPPQEVADRISAILRASSRIDSLILKGRSLPEAGWDPSDGRALVKEVRQAAKDLRGLFSAYFLEIHASDYSFRVPTSRDPFDQLAVFLRESQKISSQLGVRLNDYFLSASPGAVDIAQFRGTSILTLTESMERLAQLVDERMRLAPGSR